MTDTPERPLPADMDATDRSADPKPERPISAAPSPEANNQPEGGARSFAARDLQENGAEGEVRAAPGSDAEQANQAPHVG